MTDDILAALISTIILVWILLDLDDNENNKPKL